MQSYFNDGLGRRMTIFIFSILFSIGGVLQTVAQSFWIMCLGRFISGAGLAVLAISVSIYNAEIAPREIRGRIIGLQQLMVAIGIAAAYWMNYIFAKVDTSANPALRLEIPLGLQLVPSVLLAVGIFYVPESPRWLVMKGKIDEARAALARVRELPQDSEEVNNELQDIVTYLETRQTSTWKETFGKENRPRLGVGLPLVLFQQFAGQNLINYFAPEIFKNIGITGEANDLFATGVVGIVKMVMTVPSLWVIDRAGRRPLMLIGTVVMLASFFYIGIYKQVTSNETAVDTAGYLAIIMVYIFMAGYAISWGVLHYVLPGEIYPQNIRAKAETLNGIVDGIFQIVSIKIGPILINTLPKGGVYFFYAACLTVFLVWIFVCLPETKGIALEDMGIVFANWKRWQKVEIPKRDEEVTVTGEPLVSKRK
ncbi:general substrate transporter [Gorgonomyces haynaldii]|nr:general substrate transporter [Gorgonomyces haynaldii]